MIEVLQQEFDGIKEPKEEEEEDEEEKDNVRDELLSGRAEAILRAEEGAHVITTYLQSTGTTPTWVNTRSCQLHVHLATWYREEYGTELEQHLERTKLKNLQIRPQRASTQEYKPSKSVLSNIVTRYNETSEDANRHNMSMEEMNMHD